MFLMCPITGDGNFHLNIQWYFLSFSTIKVQFKICDE